LANHLSSIKAQLMGKDQAYVHGQLGLPVTTARWKKTAPPQGANAAETKAFEDTSFDEIWVYASGRIHFSISGIVLDVDDDVSLDMPNEELPTMMA